MDKIAWAALGPSWAENCRAANISYYVVIPLDPHTSMVRGGIRPTRSRTGNEQQQQQ